MILWGIRDVRSPIFTSYLSCCVCGQHAVSLIRCDGPSGELYDQECTGECDTLISQEFNASFKV